MTCNDYQPAKEEIVKPESKGDTISFDDTISVLTWNIGYAGLDSSMDFFYDGGEKVRPEECQVKKNESAIIDYLSQESKKGLDFIYVQEIDKSAKRSYNQNQVEDLGDSLKSFHCYFGKNYDVKWVPVPIYNQMGYVESGIALYSIKEPSSVIRHSYPFNFSWPLKVFMLDRCFLCSRFKLPNGKELLMIVTHNSAFDGDGYLRKSELNYLKYFLQQEYSKGNYVIMGGDFNQCPTEFDPKNIRHFDYSDYYTVPDTLLPGWNYVYDKFQPTNRRVIAPYDSATTLVTVIDFFITSPNVSTVNVKTDNLEFSNSDHNPVWANFVLRQEP